MKYNYIAVIPLFFLLLASIATARDNVNKENSTIVIWLDGKGKKPFAPDATYNAAATFQSAVLGHLIYTDLDFDLKPGLIKSWTYDYKNEVYILNLAQGLKFHNGRSITARDLEFSLLRGFLSKANSFYKVILSNIDGVEALKPGEKFRSGIAKGISVTSELQLKIKLKYPNPSFLHNLSYSYFSLVPIEELESDYFTWKRLPVGAGPYKVLSSDPKSSSVQLERVEESGHSPRRVEMITESEPRQTDIYLGQPEGVPQDYQRELSPISNSVATIIFNFNNALGRNLKFRDALSFAIKRSDLIKGDDSISPTVDLLPRHFWGRFNPPEEFDSKKAKALGDEVRLEAKALSLPIEIPVRTSEISEESLKVLKEQISKAGVEANFIKSKQKFWEKSDTTTVFSLVSITMPDVDPLLEFAIFRNDSPFKPFVPVNDKKYEELYLNASQSASFDLRVDTIKALSKYIFENKIAIPLFERKSVVRYRKAKIDSIGKQDGRLSFYIERIKLHE